MQCAYAPSSQLPVIVLSIVVLPVIPAKAGTQGYHQYPRTKFPTA